MTADRVFDGFLFDRKALAFTVTSVFQLFCCKSLVSGRCEVFPCQVTTLARAPKRSFHVFRDLRFGVYEYGKEAENGARRVIVFDVLIFLSG
jgi:hypothetical protein